MAEPKAGSGTIVVGVWRRMIGYTESHRVTDMAEAEAIAARLASTATFLGQSETEVHITKPGHQVVVWRRTR